MSESVVCGICSLGYLECQCDNTPEEKLSDRKAGRGLIDYNDCLARSVVEDITDEVVTKIAKGVMKEVNDVDAQINSMQKQIQILTRGLETIANNELDHKDIGYCVLAGGVLGEAAGVSIGVYG